MTPEQITKKLFSDYGGKLDYCRDEIAEAIRAAVEAERAKYRALLEAVDRVTFLHWNSHEWSQSRMETAMEVLLNARKELP